MFNIAVDNPDVLCPDCRHLMVELAKFREVMDEDGGLGSDSPLFILGGNRSGINPFAVLEIFNGLFDAVLLKMRNRKVERLCMQVLPRYPKSLICPSCLYLWRRIG